MNKANYSIESRPTVKQLNALTSQGILYVLVNKELNTIYVHEYNQQNRYKQFSICARQTTGRPGVNGNWTAELSDSENMYNYDNQLNLEIHIVWFWCLQ